jgi:uncharacterized membrane protein YeiH
LIVQILDLLGVAVFAVSGALAAGRKRLDLLGVVVIATVTAIGGGTTRDVLLDRRPFWVDDPGYLVATVVAAGLTILWVRRWDPPHQALEGADALGLGFFVIGGAQIAQSIGLHSIIVVLMGTITGTVGGVIRDILTNEIPMVLRKGELYATAAILGCALYLLLGAAGVGTTPAALAGMTGTVLLRIASLRWGLQLPVFSFEERDGDEGG